MPLKIETRKHLERSQPAARQRYGLLEKHKDYVLRARDYHKKEKQLRILREKARFRNDDEFYHAMIKSQSKKGKHSEIRNNQFDGDLLKLLKSQDLKYVQYQRDLNRKKVDSVKSELKALGVVPPSSSSSSSSQSEKEESSMAEKGTHLKFITSDDLDTFECSASPAVEEEVPPMEQTKSKKIRKLLKQLELRFIRADALIKAETELQTQKNLMHSSGRRYKVGQDERGNSVYRWRAERLK